MSLCVAPFILDQHSLSLTDGISREERMKMVRERQLEDHKRRLDELRQAQIHAMKAKQQLDDERRRRLDEIKGREDQRRAAVEARRKRIEDIERVRSRIVRSKIRSGKFQKEMDFWIFRIFSNVFSHVFSRDTGIFSMFELVARR